MSSKEAKEYLMNSSIRYTISNLHDVFRVNNNDLEAVIDDVITITENAFDAGIEFERQRHGWHNVKIELPKEHGEYLVSYDENCKNSFYVLFYDDSNWYEEGSELSVSKPYWWKEIE